VHQEQPSRAANTRYIADCHVIITIAASSSPCCFCNLIFSLQAMPSKSKNEVKVGQRIEALVKQITSDAAAKRFYGAEWDKQRCPGIVTRVEKVLTNPNGKVKQTMVTAIYSLPDGRKKSVNLNKCSVYITDESPPANPPNILLLLLLLMLCFHH